MDEWNTNGDVAATVTVFAFVGKELE